PVIEVEALRTAPIDMTRLVGASRVARDSLFRVEWVDVSPASTSGNRPRLAVIGEGLDIDAERFDDLSALAAAIDAGAPASQVALFAADPTHPDADVAEAAREAVRRT